MPPKAPIAARKVREAEFFLQHLERTTRDTTTEPTEASHFYLSAFLSSAKSVVEIVARNWEGHGKLYQRWAARLPQKDRDAISFLGDQRNAEVHRLGARVRPAKMKRRRVQYPSVQVLKFTDLIGAEIEYGPNREWIVVTREEIEQRFTISGQQRSPVEVGWHLVSLLRNLLKFIEEAK